MGKKVAVFNVEDQFPYGHGEKSVYLIERFLRLIPAEAVAIRWHMGGFDDAARGGCRAISEAYDAYPLAVKLHLADLTATYLMEKGHRLAPVISQIKTRNAEIASALRVLFVLSVCAVFQHPVQQLQQAVAQRAAAAGRAVCARSGAPPRRLLRRVSFWALRTGGTVPPARPAAPGFPRFLPARHRFPWWRFAAAGRPGRSSGPPRPAGCAAAAPSPRSAARPAAAPAFSPARLLSQVGLAQLHFALRSLLLALQLPRVPGPLLFQPACLLAFQLLLSPGGLLPLLRSCLFGLLRLGAGRLDLLLAGGKQLGQALVVAFSTTASCSL